MRTIVTIGGVVFLLAGLGLLGYAVYFPIGFQLSTASAIQIQQVYGQATYYAVGGVGALLVAIVCVLLVILLWIEELAARTATAASPAS